MSKLLLFFISINIYSHANSIDKTKILEIIQAAKQNKAIMPTKTNTDETIQVVYRKPSTKPKKQIFGKLLSIPPSSVTLRKEFLTKKFSKKNDDIPFFKTPIQRKQNGIKTTATKIKYY